MSKSKRILELMMTVNRRRKFTVKELAQEFGVSQRTILRDLQELSELGVPLYSEVGPHGGYQVLNERILPPIAFTEEEAVSIFFAGHALRHFSSLPFETEYSSALNKFYFYMSGEVRDRIDEMKNRVDIITPHRSSKSPYLSALLAAAIQQKVIEVEYASRGETTKKEIQPIGIYASNGLWYCPAYCFLRNDFRLFRCDRIHNVGDPSKKMEPMDFSSLHLGNRRSYNQPGEKLVKLIVELNKEGVQQCESEIWAAPELGTRNDGTGWLECSIPITDLDYFAEFFIGMGKKARVKQPQELLELMRIRLRELLHLYK